MSSFAGVQATRTGAYDPNGTGNNVIRATLATQTQAICGTGSLGHVGRYKVKARVWATSLDVRVRLSYRAGDNSFGATPAGYVAPPVKDAFAEVDLGEITVPPTLWGAQSWEGRIDAYSDTIGDTLDIDYLMFIPVAEGYGKARGAYSYQPGSLVTRDDFADFAAGTALDARVAPVGGTWATSGATTDFTAADGPNAGDETITRATTLDSGPRYAIVGATNYTNSEVAISYRGSAEVGGSRHHGVIARWVDSSNYLRLSHQSTTSVGDVWVEAVVGGSVVMQVEMGAALTVDTWFRLRLIVWESGHGIASWFNASGTELASTRFHHTALATGGALATGKPGIIDRNGSAFASTRYYDDFYAATPPAEEIVINSGQAVAFRHDACLRLNATGTIAGKPWYRGDRVLVPQAGYMNRDTRFVCKARRNDVDVMGDPDIADATLIHLIYVPRYRMPVGGSSLFT